ncbi:MAG: biotin--[acetyl-CoA-carboxylase] ligase [Candidatus Zhuqueibacterota bacterium]
MTSGFSFDLLSEEKIRASLEGTTFVNKIYAFWTVSSTNNFAYKLAMHGLDEGTLVIAEEQSHGRGRKARVWDSQFNQGLWFSLILRPDIAASKVGLLPFLASVSIAEAVESLIGLRPELKWPNDALLAGKKFCGILSEVEFINGRIKFIILGIGLNVNHKPDDFSPAIREQATSLRIQAGIRINRTDLLAHILRRFEINYSSFKSNGISPILKQWKARCSRLGKSIQVVQEDTRYDGIFQDIDSEGCLILKLNTGQTLKVIAGDVVF